VQQPSTSQTQTAIPQFSANDFPTYDFTNTFPTDQIFSDSAFADALQAPPQNVGYNTMAVPTSSTDLVRRGRVQNGQQEQWVGASNLVGQNQEEDEEDLETKVALAKRDAQGKRKQIPPFVQKLSR
jgi:heat shock transcription factor